MIRLGTYLILTVRTVRLYHAQLSGKVDNLDVEVYTSTRIFPYAGLKSMPDIHPAKDILKQTLVHSFTTMEEIDKMKIFTVVPGQVQRLKLQLSTHFP